MKNSKKLILPVIAIGSMLLTGCKEDKKVDTTKNVNDGPVIKYDGNTANGVFDFSEDTREEQTNKLAVLEEYALTHNMAGIPLFDNTSYVKFSPRLQLPTTKYVENVGFGVMKAKIDPEGTMEGGKKVEGTHPSYLRDYDTVDSGTLNAWDSLNGDVSQRYADIQSALFDVGFSDDKKSFKWKTGLCKDVEPIMLEEVLDEKGNPVLGKDGRPQYKEVTEHAEEKRSKFWRFRVRHGEKDNATYRTAEFSPYKDKFDKRAIQLEDYLTPIKVMLDNGFKRQGELLNSENGFEGLSEYLRSKDKSMENFRRLSGFNINEEKGSIDVRFITPKNAYFSRYTLATSQFAPMPMEFINLVGIENFGKLGNEDKDAGNHYRFSNMLCTGAFILEEYENNKSYVVKRNDDYFANFIDKVDEKGNVIESTKDKKPVSEWFTTLEGQKTTIVEKASVGYERFLNGEFDLSSIPAERIKDKDKGVSFVRPGTSVATLAINSCTQNQWNHYFGEEGLLAPHDKKDYYNVKSIMSDKSFINGVKFAINRPVLSETNGSKPFCTYLSDAYTLDPNGKQKYRDTEQGRKVFEKVTAGRTDTCGYAPDIATSLFKKAIETGLENGTIQKNGKIKLESFFSTPANVDNYGKLVKRDVEKVFNDAGKEFGITLEFETKSVTTPLDIYDKVIDQGKFDFAFGMISGGTNNPIAFMKNCSSTYEISNGFCMNFGEPTSEISQDKPLMYPTKKGGKPVAWSYDAFWRSATSNTVVINGKRISYADGVKIKELQLEQRPGIGLSFRTPEIKQINGKDTVSYSLNRVEVAFGKFENSVILEDSSKFKLHLDKEKQSAFVWVDRDYLISELTKLGFNKSDAKLAKKAVAIEAIIDCSFNVDDLHDKSQEAISDYTTVANLGLM